MPEGEFVVLSLQMLKKSKSFWRKFDRFTPYVLLAVLLLAALNLLLSFLLFGLIFGKRANLELNVGTLNPPVLAVKEPVDNQQIKGKAPVTLSYPEGFGFAKVEMWIDGQLVRELAPPPAPNQITFDFDSQKFVDGEHTLSFNATDMKGFNQSASVRVSIANKTRSR